MKLLYLLLGLCILLAACTETHTYILPIGSSNGSVSLGGNATDTIYLSLFCDDSPCNTMYWVTQT